MTHNVSLAIDLIWLTYEQKYDAAIHLRPFLVRLADNDYIDAVKNDAKKIKRDGDGSDSKFDPVKDVFGSFGHQREGIKKPMNTDPKPEQERFVKVWSLTGGVAAKLEINSIPSKKDQDFLKLCLERALDELKEIEESKLASLHETKSVGPDDLMQKSPRKYDLA